MPHVYGPKVSITFSLVIKPIINKIIATQGVCFKPGERHTSVPIKLTVLVHRTLLLARICPLSDNLIATEKALTGRETSHHQGHGPNLTSVY